jgi:hypothetical protein
LILVDLPARSRDAFTSFIRELDSTLWRQNQAIELLLFMFWDKTRSSVSALKDVVELCGNEADYVVVKKLASSVSRIFY